MYIPINELKYNNIIIGDSVVGFDLVQSIQNYKCILRDKYMEWKIERTCRNLQRKLDGEAKKGANKKRKVYFIVSKSLSAKVKEQMDKRAREDIYKYSESHDMPVIAVVEDDKGPLEVVVNNIKTRVQLIGFVATWANMLWEGDDEAAEMLRNRAMKNKPTDNSDLYVITDDVVVDDEGKTESQPVTSFLYAVWDKNMDDMYRNVTLNDDGAFTVWNQNREHNAYNLLLRLAKGYILNDGYKDYDALKGLNKYTTEKLEKALDDIVTGKDQRTFWSIVRKTNDPMSILIKFFCDNLGAFTRDANNVGLQYDDIDVFVLPMMQTYSSDGKERWVDVLKNGNFNEIAAFNSTTAMFCRTLYYYVYGKNGLIQQLRKPQTMRKEKRSSMHGPIRRIRSWRMLSTVISPAKEATDDEKRQKIVDDWIHKDKRYLENALNAHIHLADQRHYNITYDATSHKIRISIDVGSGTDSKVVTLFETNIDNDIPDVKQAPIVQTQIGGQFLKNLLYNEETGGLNMTRDASGSNRDYCIAHWQLDYQNFDCPMGRYFIGSEKEKNAIREKMMRLVTDGLIYMRTYDIRPSTPTPVVANPFMDKTTLSYQDTVERFTVLERYLQEEYEEKQRSSIYGTKKEDDDAPSREIKYHSYAEAMSGLELVNREGEKHIDRRHPFKEKWTKRAHLTVSTAIFGTQHVEPISLPDGTSINPLERDEYKDYDSANGLCNDEVLKHISVCLRRFIHGWVSGKYNKSSRNLGEYCPNYSHRALKWFGIDMDNFIRRQKESGITIISGISICGTVRVRQTEKPKPKDRPKTKKIYTVVVRQTDDHAPKDRNIPTVDSLDLMGIDDDGVLYVYIVRCMNTIDEDSSNYRKKMFKYNLQASLYKTLLEQKGLKVSDRLTVLLVYTPYAIPKGERNGSMVYRLLDKKSDQMYNDKGHKIYANYTVVRGTPKLQEPITVNYSNIGTAENPLIYEQYNDKEKAIIDGTVYNAEDILTNAEGEIANTPPTPILEPIDEKAEGLEKPEETYTPSPEPTPPAQPVQTKKETFPDSVKETFMKNGYEWTDVESEVRENEPEKADSILASLKSCCKKQLGLKDDVSEDEFAKTFKEKISENEDDEVDEIKEQILRCAQEL